MNNGRKLKVKWLSGRGSEQERRNKEREVRKVIKDKREGREKWLNVGEWGEV